MRQLSCDLWHFPTEILFIQIVLYFLFVDLLIYPDVVFFSVLFSSSFIHPGIRERLFRYSSCISDFTYSNVMVTGLTMLRKLSVMDLIIVRVVDADRDVCELRRTFVVVLQQ